ncbi:MAG: hypothetical protein V3S24_03900 [Candidatus Tectomicrobia bacterium]
MDQPQKPLYTGPMFPLASQAQRTENPKQLRGTVVGVYSGRNGEAGTTRILTIQLSTPHPEACELLHADVEIVVHTKP